MTVYFTGSSVVFNDGTSKTSASFSWSQVSGAPSYLSQFTNNEILVGTGGIGTTQGNCGNCGNVNYGYAVNTYQSGYTVYAQAGYGNCYNCNCNCNCNC